MSRLGRGISSDAGSVCLRLASDRGVILRRLSTMPLQDVPPNSGRSDRLLAGEDAAGRVPLRARDLGICPTDCCTRRRRLGEEIRGAGMDRGNGRHCRRSRLFGGGRPLCRRDGCRQWDSSRRNRANRAPGNHRHFASYKEHSRDRRRSGRGDARGSRSSMPRCGSPVLDQ